MTTRIAKATAVKPGAAGSLPEWFTANRVHGHTRLVLSRWHDTKEFETAAAGFKALGARAFTRHVKTGDDDPWWPAGGPPGPNVVQAFIDSAHAEGMRIFVYYWHMSQKSLEESHPEYICKKQNGATIQAARRGAHLDITGPYREVVLGHLLELAAMGADGLFFDYRHLPSRGCWGSALAAAWQARTGAAPPSPDDTDPVYQQFLDFKAEQIEETFVYWRDRIKAQHPNVLFIISTTTVAALTDREMTTRLVRLADSPKNEYRHALNVNFSKHVFDGSDLRKPADHVRQALGWTVLRDAADGRPPHIWAPGVPTSEHAQAFAGSLLTFGCIANMDAHEHSLVSAEDIPEGKTPQDALRDAFALGNAASPPMAGTQPLRWVAVHFGERSRNARGGDFRAAWEEVLWPLAGAYQALTEDGVPVGIVNDHQLEHGELEGYQMLVLPNPNELTSAQRRAITAFTKRGGAVVENDPAWRWSDVNEGAAAAAAFRAAVAGHLKMAPLRVTGGPTGRYAVAYHSAERLVVAVTNDFSWVQIQWRAGTVNPKGPAATGVRVAWRKSQPVLQGPPGIGRLRAVEAISGKTLSLEESPNAYHVSLPRFQFMALLVVTRESPTLPQRDGGKVGPT